MKRAALILSFLFLALSYSPISAETVTVGLEPFPPLVEDADNGLVVKMLKQIEANSDLKFDIKIMPYSRAKKELENKNIDFMGMTPFKFETKDFYEYALELDWNIDAQVDLFTVDKDSLDPKKLATMKRIGTPHGNKGFLSEVLEIPIENFYEGKADSLVKMLEKKRIDAYVFARSSTMSLIKRAKISPIYYLGLISLPASMAVQNNSDGMKLKVKLDKELRKVSKSGLLKEYLAYLKMKNSGIVPID